MSSNDLYTDEYLTLTVKLMKDEVKSLSLWSAYNNDTLGEEIEELKNLLERIRV
jgi:hypothetical protein